MNILGIHGGLTPNQHDPAAALIVDGELIACIEEERLYRNKTARGVMPVESIIAVLKEGGLTLKDIDIVASPSESLKNIESRIQDFLTHHFGYAAPVKAINHQTAHLASAFYHSGFDDAMCLSYDAFGDGLSGAYGIGGDTGIVVTDVIKKDNSLGFFYATITSFLGFLPGEDEYKVMGLAPYGDEPADLSFFAKPTDDGYFVDHSQLRKDMPNGPAYERLYGKEFVERLGEPRRKGEKLTQHHINIALGGQKALEACVVSLIEKMHNETGLNDLCVAGGVALNCSANGVISKLPFIDKFFVQPAASDRGLALGCALQIAHENGETLKPLNHVFYGPTYSDEDIVKALRLTGFKSKIVSDPADAAVGIIAEGGIVGWFQGRSEFGPRALGHRSILADPGRSNMKDEINARVKFREEFRPFAPSVLEERASELFDMDGPSPYMTMAFDVKEAWRGKLPAITHVNNTARVQTVNKEIDPLYHSLIEKLGERTGIPVVLNTSFNIRGQPIVEAPLEALSTFAGTGIDALIIGNHLVSKPAKPRS